MFKEYVQVLFLFVFVISFKNADSIQCYECSSKNNSMCLDPSIYDQETLRNFLPFTTCGRGVYTNNNQDFFCRKIIQTILHKHYEPEIRVTRTCGWVRHHRDCYKADNEDHLETVCQCFSDHCNAGAKISGAMTLVALVTLKAYF
ncbi:unnamed protein product [Arctia plantaginis]|uniref:Protein sleepless n=1 Tax=Arctia plantaginis TaxID=874455 RepID=A0A8S0ZKK0_ARCPL|nr:unnamed protein product [Arctia plantaginis]